MLVISGGVSEGAFDLVEEVLARFDVGLLFTKVAIKPGAPLVFGRRGDKLVFGLPGNPVSAQVTFDVFVRAALLRMQGARVVLAAAGRGRAAGGDDATAPAAEPPARRASAFEDGRLVAAPRALRGLGGRRRARARQRASSSSTPRALQAAAGEKAPALLLGNFLERDGSRAEAHS